MTNPPLGPGTDPAGRAADAATPPAAARGTGSPRPIDVDPATDPAPDPGGSPSPQQRRPTWWRVSLLAGIAAVVLAIDAITKVLIVASIAPGENVRILGGLVYLTQIRNAGAAFNMATGMTWVLAIIAIAVVAFIIRMAPRMRSTPWAVCLGLVLGGALGNLSDRVFRAPGFLQGHVVDFVSVFGPNAEHFPAFNAADSAITIGGIMLVLIALLGYDFDGTRHRGRRAAPATAAAAGGSGGADLPGGDGANVRGDDGDGGRAVDTGGDDADDQPPARDDHPTRRADG